MAVVTIPELAGMRRERRKIVGVVVWDQQMARIADRAGADVLSVGDSVGIHLWGHAHPLEITMEEMLTVARAVRRGATRALVSCDFPYGPLQEGVDSALRAAIRFVKEAGAGMVKLDGAAQHLDAVAAITRAGIPVWAQLGLTPQTALHYGVEHADLSASEAAVPDELVATLTAEARELEHAGAAMLDLTNAGPVIGRAVVEAVDIPVLGGLGGGPWLDGRVRLAHAAIGYAATGIDGPGDGYANVARVAHDAIAALVDDVRAGRQVRGSATRQAR